MATQTRYLNPAVYIDGLTLEEVQRYINTLPMTKLERSELLHSLHRSGSGTGYVGIDRLNAYRTLRLKEYLTQHGKATRTDIGNLLGLGAGALDHFISYAKQEGILGKCGHCVYVLADEEGANA